MAKGPAHKNPKEERRVWIREKITPCPHTCLLSRFSHATNSTSPAASGQAVMGPSGIHGAEFQRVKLLASRWRCSQTVPCSSWSCEPRVCSGRHSSSVRGSSAMERAAESITSHRRPRERGSSAWVSGTPSSKISIVPYCRVDPLVRRLSLAVTLTATESLTPDSDACRSL